MRVGKTSKLLVGLVFGDVIRVLLYSVGAAITRPHKLLGSFKLGRLASRWWGRRFQSRQVLAQKYLTESPLEF